MDVVERAANILHSGVCIGSVIFMTTCTLLTHMCTAIQHLPFRISEGIFVTAHLIIILVLAYLSIWIVQKKPRTWRQDVSLGIIVICVAVFICVPLTDPKWFIRNHLIVTFSLIVLLIIFGMMILSTPKETEEVVRVPEQPIILPLVSSEPSLPDSPDCEVEARCDCSTGHEESPKLSEKRLEERTDSANGVDDISEWSWTTASSKPSLEDSTNL